VSTVSVRSDKIWFYIRKKWQGVIEL
jgi:hypothetical protein